MTNKTTPFNSIEKIVTETLAILSLAKEVPQMCDSSVDDHQAMCRKIPGYIREGRLKIAVVGVIKSGKSTFVNALVGKELVKRGAGVITSITTRIRKGKKNQARLYFKSWDDINAQLRKALLLFPHDGFMDFDIRRKKDRDYLKTVYQTLIHDFPITKQGVHPETLLIRHALNGFETCKDLVQADEAILCFPSKKFDRHKIYTSDPDTAFYVKDVCLDVYGNAVDPNIEIADCQGADSTDPASLDQVLTYLESSNLIIYCISSRTGIRQSDITFLKQIKNIGLLENILFVNNCDLTEHDNLDDLVKIEAGIQRDLEFLEIHPIIFSFSSLYNLFFKLEKKLRKKDLTRLKLWQEEKKMVEYCHVKTNEFNCLFEELVNKKRHELLISNHLNRLKVILSQLEQRADIFLDLLSSDKQKQEKAVQNLDNLHQNAARLESIVANSIQGAVSGLTDEIQVNIKEFFVQDKKAVLKDCLKFIRMSSIDVEQYRSVAKESGFNQILYLMFQAFKRKLDVYVIEHVKPRLKNFVEEQEERILAYFQSLFDSYKIDLVKSDPYLRAQEPPGMGQQLSSLKMCVEIDTLKKILGLHLPIQVFEAKYTPRIKVSMVTGFYFQTLSQIVASLFFKKSRINFSPGLKKAVAAIKKENQKIIKDQFRHYHTILQTDYFLPLIEAATRDFKEKISEHFNQYNTFKEETEHLFSLKQSEKKAQAKKVHAIKQKIAGVTEEISSIA